MTLPVFVLELLLTISFALCIAMLRGTYFDTWAVVVCVAMMSISLLFYIIGGQFLFGKVLRLVPISGFDGGSAVVKFIALPVLVSVIAGLGYGTRWYRTLFLEEINRDYVRTARAKGLSERAVLFKHVLRNALIPILTGVVVILPTLFIGNLIIEAFFRHSRARQLHHRSHPEPGLRDCACHGVPGLAAVHRRPHSDGYFLHPGRPAGASE